MLDRSLLSNPHRRLNVLTGRWILVSPNRAKRPWQGRVEPSQMAPKPHYVEACYLCPGNTRAAGQQNPDYDTTFAFDNDFASLHPDSDSDSSNHRGLLVAEAEQGLCRVLCYSPRHDLSMAEMSVSQIENIVNLWVREFDALARRPELTYVQIFENKGEIMGCSNSHPHGQIWAQSALPHEVELELAQMAGYLKSQGRPLLQAYLELELELGERVICANEAFVVVVPYWAMWPFETLVLPRRQVTNFSEMTVSERRALAAILRELTVRYDNLFEISFPYTQGIHQAPVDGKDYPEFTWHMHFYPPLLRSATVKKFMSGYEMLADLHRDISPEYCAERLRELSVQHYKHRQEAEVDCEPQATL